MSATAVLKDAPHPNTAWLFARWATSEEGQKVWAEGGRNPAHPKIEPVEKVRPRKIYAVTAEDLKRVFQIRENVETDLQAAVIHGSQLRGVVPLGG